MVKEQFIRNLGIMSEEDLNTLQASTIAIAGCGCIGGFAAELLTRMGIGGLKLADPDTFDVSNINRQCAANHHTIGQRKVKALKDHLIAINPDVKIDTYYDRIQLSNAEEFLDGVDYVIDAIDYFGLADAVALHQAARKKQLTIITAAALGFGTSVLAFSPTGMTLEEYIGLDQTSNIEGMTISANHYTSLLPDYVTEEKIKNWINSKFIPTISVGQALGPGVLVSQLVLHLLGRKEPKYVPSMFQLQLEVD